MSKNVHKNTRKNAPDKVHDVDAAPVEAREETPADTAGAGELKGDETLEAGKASIQESGASGPDEDAALTTRDLVEKLTRERDDFLERLKRERASFLNHKKRVEKERREWESASICRFVQELLPFIDELCSLCRLGHHVRRSHELCGTMYHRDFSLVYFFLRPKQFLY